MIDGAKIQALREQAGLTQTELGEIVGAEQSMIGYIEREVKRPSVELLARIADHFGVTMGSLRKKEKPHKTMKDLLGLDWVIPHIDDAIYETLQAMNNEALLVLSQTKESELLSPIYKALPLYANRVLLERRAALEKEGWTKLAEQLTAELQKDGTECGSKGITPAFMELLGRVYLRGLEDGKTDENADNTKYPFQGFICALARQIATSLNLSAHDICAAFQASDFENSKKQKEGGTDESGVNNRSL